MIPREFVPVAIDDLDRDLDRRGAGSAAVCGWWRLG